MKKITKLLAGITSAVMLTQIGALENFAVSGVTLNPEISFEITADKTRFSRAEVEAGEAVATVSFICNECDNDLVSGLWVDIKSMEDGMYIRNVQLTEPNAFTSDGGHGSLAMDFNLYDTAPDDLTELSQNASFYLMNSGAEKFVKNDEENVVATFEVVFTEEAETRNYSPMINYTVSGTDDGGNVNELNDYVTMNNNASFFVGDMTGSGGYMTGAYAFNEMNIAWSTDNRYFDLECFNGDDIVCYNNGDIYEIYSRSYPLYIVPESEEAIKKLNLGDIELKRDTYITNYAEGIPENAVTIYAKSREELDGLIIRAEEWLDKGYITYANAVEYMEYECRTGYGIRVNLKEADLTFNPQEYLGFEDIKYTAYEDGTVYIISSYDNFDNVDMGWLLHDLENDERVEKVGLDCMCCCTIHRAVEQEEVIPRSEIKVPDSAAKAHDFYKKYGETIVTNGGRNAIVVLPRSTEAQAEDGFDAGYAYLDKSCENYTINSMEQYDIYMVYDITLNGNEDIQIDVPFIDFKTGDILEFYSVSLKYKALEDGIFTYPKLPLTSASGTAAAERGETVIIEGNQAVIFTTGLTGYSWAEDISDPLTAPESVSEESYLMHESPAEEYICCKGDLPCGQGVHDARTYKFENDGEYIVTIEKYLGGYLDCTTDYKFSMTDGVLTLESIEVTDPDPFAANTDFEAVEKAVWGDVNSDGEIDAADIVSLNMYLLSPENVSLTEEGFVNANCSFDERIDSTDSAALMNFVSMAVDYSTLGVQLVID